MLSIILLYHPNPDFQNLSKSAKIESMTEENKTIQTENNPSADKAAPVVEQAKQPSAPASKPPASPPLNQSEPASQSLSEGGSSQVKPAEPSAPTEPETQKQAVPEELSAAPTETKPKQAVEPEEKIKQTEQTNKNQPQASEKLIKETLSASAKNEKQNGSIKEKQAKSDDINHPTGQNQTEEKTAQIQAEIPASKKEQVLPGQSEPKIVLQAGDKLKTKPLPKTNSALPKKESEPITQAAKTRAPAPPTIAKQPKIQPVAKPKQPASAKQENKISLSNYLKKLSEFRILGNAKRQKKMQINLDKIMEYAGKTQKVVNDDVERLTGVKDDRAVQYLNILVKKGYLVRFGKTSNIFYKPTNKGR